MSDRPKAVRVAEALADAEQRIVDALPGIVDRLIKQAEAGDLKAAVYLLDRIMGKPGASLLDRETSEEARPRIVIPGIGDRARIRERLDRLGAEGGT